MARKKGLSKAEQGIIQRGKKIEDTLKTQGWKHLIEPMLDEMIYAVLGVKKNNRWIKGSFVKARKEEKKDFWTGYVCALQEFRNSVQNYIFSSEVIKKRIEERSEIENKTVIPMVNDVEEEIQDF